MSRLPFLVTIYTLASRLGIPGVHLTKQQNKANPKPETVVNGEQTSVNKQSRAPRESITAEDRLLIIFEVLRYKPCTSLS